MTLKVRAGFKFRIILLFLILLLSVYLFLHSSIFRITGIDVIGNERVSKEEAIALSGLTTGINIFTFDEVSSAKSIGTHPLVKLAEIKRHLNRTVSINITERQIWAVVPYGDLFLCIDDTGVCFDKMPYISIANGLIITLDKMPEHVTLGQAVNSQATDMIWQVWQAIPADKQKLLSEIHYFNDTNSINIYTLKGTEVHFGDLDRLEEKIKFFDEIFQIENDYLKQGRDVLEYVDIRFKGEPVLKTKN